MNVVDDLLDDLTPVKPSITTEERMLLDKISLESKPTICVSSTEYMEMQSALEELQKRLNKRIADISTLHSALSALKSDTEDSVQRVSFATDSFSSKLSKVKHLNNQLHDQSDSTKERTKQTEINLRSCSDRVSECFLYSF